MNILITGGAGYIGTSLVRRLADDPRIRSVVVFDNLSRGNFDLFLGGKFSSGNLKFVQGDILDSRTIRQQLKTADTVIHLAAKVTTPFSTIDSHFFEQVNHWGTAELVYALEEFRVKKFIYTSSTAVYGISSTSVVELTPPSPSSFYANSKWRGEQQVMRLFDKMNTLIFRCGNVYGFSPAMRFDAVINHFMFDARFKNRITIEGNGKQRRSFIQIEKLAEALHQSLFTEIPSGTYNLSDKNLSVHQIVETLQQIFPDLEYITVNQHLEMPELVLAPCEKIRPYISLPDSELAAELLQFRDQFAF